MSTVDINRYMFIPYGEDWNCWDLVRQVMADVFGHSHIPARVDARPGRLRMIHGAFMEIRNSFIEVDEPAPGDVAACYRICGGGHIMTHVGICLLVDGRLMVLHTQRNIGSRLDRVSWVCSNFEKVKWFRYASN